MSGYVFPPTATRELLVEALPEESDQRGKPPDQRNLHVPESHWRALHPDAPLVEGIRGSGKTVWCMSNPGSRLMDGKGRRARHGSPDGKLFAPTGQVRYFITS